jgi:hypothetical protein
MDGLQVVERRCCDYGSDGQLPRSLGRSVSTSWRRQQGRLSASLCDGASATLAPVTTTSTAAKTRERGRSRVGHGHFSVVKHIQI